MQRQLPESIERSASLSAAQVGGQRISLPCPAHVGQVDPLAILIMLAGLYGCDSYGAATSPKV
jgi:hypothetical protein